MKIAAAQINPTVGSLKQNSEKIIRFIEEAKKNKVELVVFPELALTGYPPEDLLVMPQFIEEAGKALPKIVEHTQGITVLLGTIRENPSIAEKSLLNTCAIIQNGELIGFQDKMLLPDYDVFSERRYFEPATHTSIWSLCGKKVAITICEDIWQHANLVHFSNYPKDPILDFAPLLPDLVINISSSPYFFGRTQVRMSVAKAVVNTLKAPFLLCNQVGGNDSLIFDGYSFFLDKNGNLISVGKGFEEDLLVIDTEKKTPVVLEGDPIQDLFSALVLSVRDYFHKQGLKKAILGLSGGIDSAVVACIAVKALGSENVLGLSMPSRYTQKESITSAEELAKNLKMELKVVSIEKPFGGFLDELAAHFQNQTKEITEENLQSRIRTLLLMAFSNQHGHLLLNTGNKSESAVGYMTLYGDTSGAIAVLGDVKKGQVYSLAKWINREKQVIPRFTLERAPSAELKHGQKDSDTLPDYSILDKVVEEYVEEHLSPEKISEKHQFPLPLVREIIKKIHLNEYKRRQSPPPLRVSKKSFTVGRRFPIVQHWNL